MGASLKDRLPAENIVPTAAGDIYLYRVGGLSMSVCAPGVLTGGNVAALINRHHPCGGTLRWAVSDEKTFKGGEPNPCVCEESPDRKHWYIDC